MKSLLLLFIVGLCSCDDNQQLKFDKVKWNEQQDPAFTSSYRKKMLRDLTQNHKLSGLRYSEIVNLLGIPDEQDSAGLRYKIVEDYGYDVDPVYTKDLILDINKDSTIKAWRVWEWKK